MVHLLGTEFRFATNQALVARLIAEGAIGEPRLATYLLLMPLLADPAGEVPAWWAQQSEGGGWLGAYASHVVDEIRIDPDPDPAASVSWRTGTGRYRNVAEDARSGVEHVEPSLEDAYLLLRGSEPGSGGLGGSTDRGQAEELTS